MTNEASAKFAKRLGTIWFESRVRQGWKQMPAATAVGCTVSELSLYESGRRVPSFERIIKMCKVYGLDVGEVAKQAESAIK